MLNTRKIVFVYKYDKQAELVKLVGQRVS